MRILTIMILITIYVQNVYSYEFYLDQKDNPIRWYTDTIDVYLDPSLEKIAPAEEIYSLIEESFLQWNDYIKEDITLNFIQEECLFSTKTCISYGYCETLATATVWNKKNSNKITHVEIRIGDNTDWGLPEEKDKIDLRPALLHEIGHFWGLEHSSDPNAIMYTYYHNATNLSDDDINGIADLYTKDRYKEQTEHIDYHVDCSINNIGNKGNTAKSILSLLF